jgi:ACS family sodium-dependent inorganic phosphate cotransporter
MARAVTARARVGRAVTARASRTAVSRVSARRATTTTRAASRAPRFIDDAERGRRRLPSTFIDAARLARAACDRGSIATCASADRRDRNDAIVASTSSGSSTAGDGNGGGPDEDDADGWEFTFPQSSSDVTTLWRGAPSRYRILFVTVFAFVVCNMDKVNISVAIIPMARDFGWTSTQAGFIQSAFFYGFAASQLPGGYLSTKLGGAKVLPIGMFILSAATMAIPIVGVDEKSIFFLRVLVGLGEGVVPSAATDIIARSVSVSERSRAVGFVFSGFNIGSVLGLGVAPLLIEATNWRMVFALFGTCGLAWSTWALKMYGNGGMVEESYRDDGVTGMTGKRVFTVDAKAIARGETPKEDPPVPWGEFTSNSSVRALMYVHFCQNWGFYVLLAWLPTYFTDELGVTLTNASLLTLLPPLANVAMATIAGPTADRLIQSGMKVTRVRKTMQTVAFMGPALAMMSVTIIDQPVATVGLLTLGISLGAFSYAGLYSNHQDLSPKYASILLGMTNTCGALPGVIGVPLTGYLIKETENWELSMFAPSIFFYVTGILLFTKFGSGERQPFTGQPMPETDILQKED